MNEFLRAAVGTICLLTAATNIYFLFVRFLIWRWTNTKSNQEAFENINRIRESFKQGSQKLPCLDDINYLSILGNKLNIDKLKYINNRFLKHDFELMALIYGIDKISSSCSKFVSDRNFLDTCSFVKIALTYDEYKSLEEIHKELFSVHHRTETFKRSYGKFFNSDGMRLLLAAIAFSTVSFINFINY